jgi:hypothetical protein
MDGQIVNAAILLGPLEMLLFAYTLFKQSPHTPDPPPLHPPAQLGCSCKLSSTLRHAIETVPLLATCSFLNRTDQTGLAGPQADRPTVAQRVRGGWPILWAHSGCAAGGGANGQEF